MNSNLQADCDLSHAIINYLNALLRGKLAFLNALRQAAHPDFKTDDLMRTEKSLETVSRWSADLAKRVPLMSTSWSMPETFEAKRALDLFSERKKELNQLAEKLERILSQSPEYRLGEDDALLVSTYVQFVYGQENFIKGYIEYGREFGRPDFVEQYSLQLPSAANEIALANWLLKELRQRATIGPEYDARLHSATYLLPGYLRMNVNDINSFLAVFEPEFTYEMADISRVEAQRWQEAGFAPKLSGYWNAFRFAPSEALQWLNAGFNDVVISARWRTAGVSPEAALRWIECGIDPETSAVWHKAGYEPSQAVLYIERGITSPEKARQGQ
ncbi:MAG: hypothetical protein J5J00_00645 [Deltaproteobacteria bacterium]|nr:hypothetical protein [Deltaproteobacteria bacterium]